MAGRLTDTVTAGLSADRYVFCPVCGQERPADVPLSGLCEDAHDDEALCADCGTALFVDPDVLLAIVSAA